MLRLSKSRDSIPHKWVTWPQVIDLKADSTMFSLWEPSARSITRYVLTILKVIDPGIFTGHWPHDTSLNLARNFVDTAILIRGVRKGLMLDVNNDIIKLNFF